MTIRPATNKGNRETTFYVTGDSGREYIIHHKRNLVSHRRVWTCNCPDFTERRQFNGTFCKHIVEVQVYQSLATILATQVQASSAPVSSPKQVVDNLISFLNNAPRVDSRLVWEIVTALRGPDDNNNALKNVTTARLRGAIGLNAGGSTGAIVEFEEPINKNLDSWVIIDELKQSHGAAYHFAKHYAHAVQALKVLGYIK